MPEKVVIIGSGPAGWTAAIYAARANLEPLVFEGNSNKQNWDQGRPPGGQLYLTTEVENFPTWPHVNPKVFQQFSESALPPDRYALLDYTSKSDHEKRAIKGPEMMEFARQQAVNFGTRVITQDIAKVDFQKRPFVLYPRDDSGIDQKPIEALSVIIATGARANYLGLPSEDRFKNNGVSACAVCDGALPRFRNKPLVVVGGGDSAVEEGTFLTKFASTVYLVHRRDQLRASKIMAQRALSNPKMQLKWNRVVEEVIGTDKDGVTGVRLKSTVDNKMEEIATSGMFAAIGHSPNTDFLAGQLKLNDKGYIQLTAPQRTYTSVDGVFAAGDVADDYYRQAITAAGTGCQAALDAERWLSHHGLV